MTTCTINPLHNTHNIKTISIQYNSQCIPTLSIKYTFLLNIGCEEMRTHLVFFNCFLWWRNEDPTSGTNEVFGTHLWSYHRKVFTVWSQARFCLHCVVGYIASSSHVTSRVKDEIVQTNVISAIGHYYSIHKTILEMLVLAVSMFCCFM